MMLGLSTKATLRIRRPSPTTIEYTVSTQPPPSVAYNVLFWSTTALRVLALCAVLLTLLALSHKHLDVPSTAYTVQPQWDLWTVLKVPSMVLRSGIGQLFIRLSNAVPVLALLPLAVGLAYLALLRPHVTETLLILRGLGVQTTTSSSTYLLSPSSRFIPTAQIQDVLVNEAFRGWEVRYYLCVVVREEKEVVVVFGKLLPGRRVCEEVWRGGRSALWGGVERVEKNEKTDRDTNEEETTGS